MTSWLQAACVVLGVAWAIWRRWRITVEREREDDGRAEAERRRAALGGYWTDLDAHREWARLDTDRSARWAGRRQT
jgi:hypothetical protein